MTARQFSDTNDFDAFLLRVGKLNYAWTNTESLLIHLIAGLAKVDLETATVIFMTLNTTRARFDLVQRLSKRERMDQSERSQLISLTTRLQKIGHMRNRYNHCIYAFDDNSAVTHTILMRIADRKDAIKMGQVEQIDSDTRQVIDAAINDLAQLNRDIWQFLHANDYPR
ncbi:MAG: hypothetical protein ACJA2X_000406 [Halocynthiibacter sp.]|jgi:hypothetical protein